MRRVISVLTILAVWSVFSLSTVQTAGAAGYPDQPINMVIPGTPGSIIDITGRIIAEELTKILGVKWVSMNKPGGSFTLGTDYVVRSKPDGYTIAYLNSSSVVTARAAKPETVPYDPDKDLEPLGCHLFFPMGLAVRADSPWKTFKELVDYAKKNPGKIRLSTSGKFSSAFFIMKILQTETGAKLTQVPYKGGTAVLTALLGGHVEACIDAAVKFTPHVKAGKMRILMATKPMKDFPDVKTSRGLGYNIDFPSPWFAFYAPKNIPDEVKNALVPAIKKAIEEPVSKAKIEKMGFVVEYAPPADLIKMVAKEYKDASEIMKKYGGE
ncbi:MAG: tripartite tricarboxylate transporter substrate binding protein [Pseudomonadota bacterium]